MPRARGLVAALVATAAMAAACGGGGSTSTTVGSASSALTSPTPGPGDTATPGPADTSSPAGTGSTTTTTTATTAACTVGAQAPPSGTLTANVPTALAFAPDGRLFFTERSGVVRVVQNGAVRTFATVATMTAEPGGGYSERGLLGLAVSPTFARDHDVFAFYSNTDHAHQTVIRWTDCAGTGTAPRVLVTLPSGADCCHKGGRLAFGPDGKLYVTLGDEHTEQAAQATSDVRGKVLRYNADGTVPSDNPFGAGNPVYAYGLRNPFGIAFSASGQLAITGNGPSGDAGSPGTGYDLVIASIARGAGYQWPLCYGYSHPLQAASCGGQSGPDWSSESSTVVPTGATFVDGAGPAPYAGHLVFCTYAKGMLVLTPGSPHATVSSGPSTCRLAVVEGPDHALYYSDDAHIYRFG